jgi:signal transduction histidine kinase
VSERHFEISATVIRQLGDQLISDEVTALMELVKNAYDADASYVKIVVDTEENYQDALLRQSGRKDSVTESSAAVASGAPSGAHDRGEGARTESSGYILVEDDGTGMDDGEIERGWLVISLSAKRGMKRRGEVTPKYQRTPLGDKGLGRLSAQRLGSRLNIFTVKEYPPTDGQLGFFSAKQYKIAVDWDAFHDDAFLSNVPVYVDDTPRPDAQTGTQLVISGLRNASVWSDPTARNALVAQLTQLISPFARTRPFKVFLTIGSTAYDFGKIADRVRSVAVSTHDITWDGRRLSIRGKIKLGALRGNDRAEVFRHMLGNDQGDAFFQFLSQRRKQIPGLYREASGWFISYSTSRDVESIGGLEYDEASYADASSEGSLLVDPGPFSGELDQFVYDESEAVSLKDVFNRSATYKDYVRDHAGVRIYRDGFGIAPYGLEGNDWLGLHSGQTSGGSFYGLRPKNVIGYVAISAKQNFRLIEKTDREGFSKNPASRNFMRLMGEAVSSVNQVFELLRRDYIEYKKTRQEEVTGFVSSKQLFTSLRAASTDARALKAPIADIHLESMAASVSALIESVNSDPNQSSTQTTELREALHRTQAQLESAQEALRRSKDVQDRILQLDQAADWLEQQFETLQHQLHEFSELASLGLTAEAVSHELSTWAARLGRETKALTLTLRRRGNLPPEVNTYAAYVRSSLTALRKQLSHLDPALRYAREEINNLSTRVFFRTATAYYLGLPSFREAKVSIQLSEPFEDFEFKMNRGKFTQIIDNLILNSAYWLNEAVRRNQPIEPTITITSQMPFITISDNGPGIDPAIEPVLFQPFITTKPSGQGRGLGLYITQQLLDSTGCELSLLPERNAYGRKYIFQIDLTGAIHGE